jgi:hypothetical protein
LIALAGNGEGGIMSVYLLCPLALLVFAVTRGMARSAAAAGGQRILQIVASNVAEIALIFAAVSGLYSLASFVIGSMIESSDATVIRIHRLDEFLKHSRKFLDSLELSTWYFIGSLLLLALFGFMRAPSRETSRSRLLGRGKSMALRLAEVLRGYRKLHKRLVITLIFAASFTFLPGMNAGDIERATSARLAQAGKQLADIDSYYQQAVAAALADVIVDRAAAALPPEYRASVARFPDGARRLDEHVADLEQVYRISLESLHRETAPYIGRFAQGEGNRLRRAPRLRDDPSDLLLAQLIASGSDVTFGDVDRVAEQVRDARRVFVKERYWKDVPKEIAEEAVSELLNPIRPGLATIKSGLMSMIDEYPWLEPVLEVVSDSVGKIVAEKPFNAAWQHLARFFDRKVGAAATPISAPVEIRVAELSLLVVPDPDVLDAHGRDVLALVMSDGRALDALWNEEEEALKKAYGELVASNKARIETIHERYRLRPGGSPGDDRNATLTAPTSGEQAVEPRVLGTLIGIEFAPGDPFDKRKWLDQLEQALSSGNLNELSEIDSKTSTRLNSDGSMGGPFFGDRGPRGGLPPIIGERTFEHTHEIGRHSK